MKTLGERPRAGKFPGRWRWITVAAALIWLGAAGIVLARAGGGDGFSGGGGGGGGGGGVGWLIFYWIQFCIDYPYFGIPITLIVVVGFLAAHRSGLSAYRGSVIRRGEDVIDDNRAADASAAMVQADADFDIGQFSRRVQLAFMKIQEAWCAQDLQTVRPFISDGVHERFSLQIDEQKALGYRDHMENVSVDSITLVEFFEGEVFDVATVRIEAAAADYRTSLSDGKRISGSKLAEPFVEMWSWLRRHGMKRDQSKPGLIEGECPNCGAAVAMNQSAKCQQCGALLRNGEFDWVLMEITQQSEWRRERHIEVPGTEAMRQTDPGFNRVEVEERASIMFWRKAMADRIGKIDPLRKVASDDFCAAYARALTPGPDGSRPFFGDCAMGSAHLMGVLPGPNENAAVLEVGWEGERMFMSAQGTARPTGERVQTHSLYLLKRKAGVTSDPGHSVSSAHCPNCGAPMTSDVSSACAFCGTVLNDESRGWVLREIASASSDAGRGWIMRIQTENARPDAPAMPVGFAHATPAGLLAWVVKVAAADGRVDPREREMLQSIASKSGVDVQAVDRLIDMALHGRLNVPDPPDHATAYIWLATMAATALADGSPQPKEVDLLHTAAGRFGYTSEDVDLLLKRQYGLRLAAAREELRVARLRQNGN